jgi:hypothetical protein
MPLQNRVTPFSQIEADPARGLFMGNRGCLHDDQRRLLSSAWKTKAWLSCVLSFRERRRVLMVPNHFTELFFLDEAVAIAAGHRPCAECRRAAYNKFLDAWQEVHSARPRAPVLDEQLHQERVALLREPSRRVRAYAKDLPDGAFFAFENASSAWLKYGVAGYLFSHGGYSEAATLPVDEVILLTPPSFIAVLGAGYRPVIHPSAAGQ